MDNKPYINVFQEVAQKKIKRIRKTISAEPTNSGQAFAGSSRKRKPSKRALTTLPRKPSYNWIRERYSCRGAPSAGHGGVELDSNSRYPSQLCLRPRISATYGVPG